MATYVKKQTLYWNANPANTVNDLGGTGNATVARSITVAESHDASSATYAGLSVQDDFVSVNGDAEMFVDGALQTATADGDIAFLRFKISGLRTNIVNTNGTVQPAIAGAAAGSTHTLTTTNTAFSQDLSTDPADGQPWTLAKVNAQSFGVYLHAWSDSASFNKLANSRATEFEVEIWGPAVPETGVITASGVDATGAAGLVVVVPLDAQVTADGVDATAVGGALTTAVDPAECVVSAPLSVADGGDLDNLKSLLDPTVVTNLATSIDGGSALVTLRSNTSPLGDENLSTYASDADGYGVPGTLTGQLVVDGHGAAVSSIEGTGLISHVTFRARARTRSDAHVVIVSGKLCGFDVYVPAAGPMVPPLDVFWTINTAPQTLDSAGNPWTWATLHSQLALDFALRANYLFLNPYQFTEGIQIDVAEIWCEVFGPVGSAPEVIEVRQVFGEHRKTVTIGSTI